MNALTTVAQYIDNENDVRRCYAVMAQLRPHLASEDDFVARWRRQATDGYRLLALLDGLHVVALAGFRVQENLVHGRFLYVDDLVTDERLRSGGHGERLMARLKQEAHVLGCGKLVLDTPLSNSLGHRFYFRNGLLASALRFSIAITQ
ncbi:MAG TPA: GNAT family N-acetyltransferase [Betaproteobacteria bacterium]|nr:GNAT family N-acetyltransferase [Betaproteobacteria bacterium]